MLKARSRQTLDRGKYVLEISGPLTPNPELAERRIAQRLAERGLTLGKDFLAVRDKK